AWRQRGAPWGGRRRPWHGSRWRNRTVRCRTNRICGKPWWQRHGHWTRWWRHKRPVHVELVGVLGVTPDFHHLDIRVLAQQRVVLLLRQPGIGLAFDGFLGIP